MRIIVLLVIGCVVAFTACSPYPRESQRMAVAFEQAQLVYGEGENDTLLFIPELDKASAYYASKKDYGKAALAALFQGYAEKDYDKTLAMNAFKEAERYGELVNDSLTVARARYQMGNLLYGDYIYEDAMGFFNKSEAYFGQHYSERSLALNSEACCYLILKDYSAADSCLCKALHYANLGDSEMARQKVLNNFAVLFKITDKYNKAIEYLKMVNPTNNQQKLLNNLNLGDVYTALEEIDSAAYYYRLVEESLTQIELKEETKAAAYGSISRLAEKQGDYLSALRYSRLHDRLQYEIQENRKQNSIYRIQKKYDYEALEQDIKAEKIKNQRNLLLYVLSSFMAIIVILLLVNRHKQMVKKEKEMELELDRVKHDLLKSVDSSIVDKELLWRLQLILKMKQYNERNQPTKTKQELMKQYILNGEKTLFDAAVSIINEAYPKLQFSLQTKYPNLSETELKVCLLSIKGLSNSDMASILEMSVYTVNKSRSNIYKKMGVEADSFKTNLSEIKSSFRAE